MSQTKWLEFRASCGKRSATYSLVTNPGIRFPVEKLQAQKSKELIGTMRHTFSPNFRKPNIG